MFRRTAGWLARQDRLPTAGRAVVGYYADSGEFDYRSLTLKRRVDRVTESMIETAFAEVEDAIADAFGYSFVDFTYDTKLVLPAQLTLGHLYWELDESDHDSAEALTRLAIEALIDGDMRDALNDNEFEDFEVDFETDEDDRRQIAEIAQEILERRVEDGFSQYSDDLREIYDWAVGVSERHQNQDEHFRQLMADAQDGDEAARDHIRTEYKHAPFDDQPGLFTAEELDFPYLKTQYDRVGVIYDGMIQMYRLAGFPVDEAFQRSIVLAIIGAQLWLDDIDDYQADMAEGQLTPVTAEYLLAETDREAYETVVAISERYLDRAKQQATVADSALTGIATEYIYRDGAPEVLPAGEF